MAKKEKENEPVHRIPVGNIRAAIWRNQNGKEGVWFNVTITRSYRDGETWKDSTSFSRDDLPVVSKVADMAYAWILERAMAAQQEKEGEA